MAPNLYFSRNGQQQDLRIGRGCNKYSYYNLQMDNDSNSSDGESPTQTCHSKPLNQRSFSHKKLIVHSNFPTGNLKALQCTDGYQNLQIQFWGNSDAQKDPLDKSWFHFCIENLNQTKYNKLTFRFKNANIYRKFLKEKRYRPYVVLKEQKNQLQGQWKPIIITNFNIEENQVIQAEFTYILPPEGVDKITIASNLPYGLSEFQSFHNSILQKIASTRDSYHYYHRQVIAQSIDEHPVYLCTITSSQNIASYDVKQADLWPSKGIRPCVMKDRPEILVTARVHPSEISSSYWLEGFITNLLFNKQFQILSQLFIFRIVPIVNPDGVQNGHYRLDHFLQNLNRFYGHSSLQKSPSICSIQSLINSLRQKEKLFMFIDVHGHNSPKPSFLFGNFSANLHHTLQNKTFARLLEIFSDGNFDSLQCEFSKNNTKVKQKYDQYSKQASARVYAYRGSQNSINLKQKQFFVEHSYTLQILPYVCYCSKKQIPKKLAQNSSHSYRSLPKNTPNLRKSQSTYSQADPTYGDILENYYKQGQNFLHSLIQLLGINTYGEQKNTNYEDVQVIRKRVFKDLIKQLQFYDRGNKNRLKEINKQVQDRYISKWGLSEGYAQFINSNPDYIPLMKTRCQSSLMYEAYINFKKEKPEAKKKQQINPKKMLKIVRQQMGNVDSQNVNTETLDGDYQVTVITSSKKKKLVTDPNRFSKPIRNIQIDPNINYDRRSPNHSQSPNKFNDFPKSFERIQRNNSNKKMIGKERDTIEELEQRIRKLIFRHKTETQIEGNEDFNFQSIGDRGNKVMNQRQRDKKIKMNELSRSKSKKKILPGCKNYVEHLKTQQKKGKMLLQEFKDTNILYSDGKKNHFHLKTEVTDSYNPKLQHIIRKASIRKAEGQEFNTIEKDCDIESSVKSVQIVQLSKLKKSNSRQKETRIRENSELRSIPESSKNFITMHSNNMLPPVPAYSALGDRSSSYEPASNAPKIRAHQKTRQLQGLYPTFGSTEPIEQLPSHGSQFRKPPGIHKPVKEDVGVTKKK